MKKYVKPEIMIESFELSHNVANCNPALNHAETETNCSISKIEGVDLGVTIFTVGSNCDYGPDIWEDYCKFTGDDTYNVFTS